MLRVIVKIGVSSVLSGEAIEGMYSEPNACVVCGTDELEYMILNAMIRGDIERRFVYLGRPRRDCSEQKQREHE